MPQAYTGNSANAARTPAIQISGPVDGDADNAASVNTPLDKIADFIAYLQANTPGLGDQDNVYQTKNTFNGYGTDGSAALTTDAVPTNRKLLYSAAGSASRRNRIYSTSAGFEITCNAVWDSTNIRWQSDDQASNSVRFKLTIGNGIQCQSVSATPNPWAEGAWGAQSSIFVDLTSPAGKLNLGANISSGTVGAGQAVPAGTAFADTLPVAWAHVTNNGVAASLSRGANIASVSRTALGKVTVTLQVATANDLSVIVTRIDTVAGFHFVNNLNAAAGSFEVWMRNDTDAAFVDGNFSVVVFGG